MCQFCIAPHADPNVSGGDLTPLVVRNDSCWDPRDSWLIFGGFFLQQRRLFRWRRHLTVYIKTDIKGAGTSKMSSGLMAIRISRCVNQHSSGDCLTRAAIPQAKGLYCPQCTRDPRWWACAWVCLFFRPYPELLYLPRPGLCRLSFSSSSLSDQTSSWPFCRQTWRIQCCFHSGRQELIRHKINWQRPNIYEDYGSLWPRLDCNVEKLCKTQNCL